MATMLIVLLGAGPVNQQMAWAQTNLQELRLLIKDLEAKLADATRKQERAYNVQMQLEEQEQRLAELEKSEAYKIQTIQIRADIQNIRTRIEAINKEKTDLEENLRVARSMETILLGAQADTRPALPETQPQPKPVIRQQAVISPISPPHAAEADTWHIENVRLGPYFDQDEQNEITNIFKGGQPLSRGDLMRNAYQIYQSVGVILDLVVQTKTGNIADLEILLRRRDTVGAFMTWVPTKTLDQFRNRDFRLTVR